MPTATGVPMRRSMAAKLAVLFCLIVGLFIIIVVIMVSSFATVQRITATIVARDVGQIRHNSELSHDLSSVLADTSLLINRYYRQPEVLEAGRARLLAATDAILAEEMSADQRSSLIGFRSALSLLLDQCAVLNVVNSDMIADYQYLLETLSSLEKNVSTQLIELVLNGEDSMAYEQVGVLIPTYREALLEIQLLIRDMDPANTEPFHIARVVELFDVLHLRLRTLLASSSDIAGLGQVLLDRTAIARSRVKTFGLAAGMYRHRLAQVDTARARTLLDMKEADEQSARAAQSMQAEMTAQTERARNLVVVLAAVVGIVLIAGISLFMFYHIRRPMASILRGIAAISGGQFQPGISLGRTDEWQIIEDALNRMSGNIHEMYGDLERNNEALRLAHQHTEQQMLALEKEMRQRQLAENEKEKLQEQLQHAQKMEAVGTLAGGVAHDFNNLLQGIQGYTELLLLRAEGQDTRELNEVLRAARRGGELTRQLLMFSRKVESNLKPLDLNQVISEVRSLVERTIPKMIRVVLHLESRLSAVRGDVSQLEQVLMNLAVNARDAMPEGGELTILTRELDVGEEDRGLLPEILPGRYVLLQVADTGVGMNQEVRERIFDPFFTTKSVGQGTGLGLAIVYGIVKNHGGYILCQSEAGAGTAFNIYLPVIEEAVVSATVEPSGPLPRGKETVLLVDDEDSIREIGQKILQEYGYTVLLAASGEDALGLYEQQREEIDLVILDIIMPGMGGEQCLRRMIEADPDVPILVASGYSANLKLGELGKSVRAFINKPFRLEEMLRVIREVLDARQQP